MAEDLEVRKASTVPASATPSASPKPFHDARSCSSPLWAFQHRSVLRTQSTHPSLHQTISTTQGKRQQRNRTHRNPSVHDKARSCPTTNQSATALRRSIFSRKETHGCPALEYNRILAWSLTVRKCTHSLSRLVFEAGQQLVEFLHAESLEKPLSVELVSVYSHKVAISDVKRQRKKVNDKSD